MGVINFTRANCRNCYKCIRHCPVKAIQMTDGQAQIIEELCIGCGNCFRVCPQNAKQVTSCVDEIKQWLKQGEVVLSLAPSFPSAFDVEDPLQIVGALKQLGFSKIAETAEGAEQVSEYYRSDYYGNRHHVITTSCPTVNRLIEKYYPQAVPYLSPVVSPMVAHGRMLRKRWPNARVVFAGPCISKKLEIQNPAFQDAVDGVMSFDELDIWFREEGIDIKNTAPAFLDSQQCRTARFYPLSGGIEKTSLEGVEQTGRRVLKIDGLSRCQDVLAHLDQLSEDYWIEMNACSEGCINGPGNTHSPMNTFKKIEKVRQYIEGETREKVTADTSLDLSCTYKNDQKALFASVPEENIIEILHQTGKFSPADELNCGTCGYDSCREKAAAVCLGMAEVDMCLPFMRNRNEAISNLIISSTPNAIAVLDKQYKILDFNIAAEKIFRIGKNEVIGRNFVDVFDYNPFKKLENSGENTYSGRGYYVNGNIHFMEILTYLPLQQMYMGIFVDISREIKKEQAYQKMQEETLEMAQKVIDKQMRVAHEIAELLGETTAETKVTLTRLQKVVGTREGDL